MDARKCLQVIQQKLKDGNEMPSLPQIIIEIQKATDNEDSSVGDLAAIVLEDISLTGKVLKLANSAYYRRSSPNISTVTQAIILLGFAEIQKMVMAISAYEFFGLMTKKSSFREIWKHSMCVGICSQRIAILLDEESPESFFVGGLLHDVGKFVMGQYFPDEYENVIKEVKAKGTFAEEVESKHFGCTHHDVGALVAKQWSLPDSILKVIYNHRFTTPSELKRRDRLTQIVCISDLIAKKTCGYELERNSIKISQILAMSEKILHIEQTDIMEIINGLGEEINKTTHMLDVAIDELKIDPHDTNDDTDGDDEDIISNRDLPKTNNEIFLDLGLEVQELAMTPGSEFKDICHDVLHRLKIVFDLRFIGLFLLNNKEQLSPTSFQGPNVDQIIPKILFKPEEATLISHTFKNKKTYLLNAELHHKLPYNVKLTSALGSSKIATFPLMQGNQTIGVLLTVKDQHQKHLKPKEQRVIQGCLLSLSNALYMSRQNLN